MPKAFPEPSYELSDPRLLFLLYLDYYRSAFVAKLDGLSDDELRTSQLPSGWTPLELLKHVVYMERRWLRWGFLGEDVAEPWGDNAGADKHERWSVGSDETLAELLMALDAGADSTRRIVESADLSAAGSRGGRFAADEHPPTLAWILFHVLQEYARHTGHLDVVRELIDGATGE